ncbi:hypothetical protein HDF26_004094 [Pedobacter cryoconitis]|uniref:hypothetical protein n=1 Tax=Pedobacter cryoconitis TaxID=188932 RepID=UPI00160B5483|nr:hypothetical protein [Pedobacter cryoconitis]MBB6273634.1 hypothetical protein [Pedobacter cryoconitis]
MNKSVYFILLFVAFFVSCSPDSGSGKNSADSAMDQTQRDQHDDAGKKKLIIAELKQMQQAFADKDVSRIEKYFSFPLADTTLSLYEINEDFDLARKANDGHISKELFVKNFNDIYDYFQMGGFSDLFKAVDLSELKGKQELASEHHVKDEGCYTFYRISIEGDTVNLQYGTNSDQTYREAHPDEEEVCGESAFNWVFRLEGNKLRFVREMTAG